MILCHKKIKFSFIPRFSQKNAELFRNRLKKWVIFMLDNFYAKFPLFSVFHFRVLGKASYSKNRDVNKRKNTLLKRYFFRVVALHSNDKNPQKLWAQHIKSEREFWCGRSKERRQNQFAYIQAQAFVVFRSEGPHQLGQYVFHELYIADVHAYAFASRLLSVRPAYLHIEHFARRKRDLQEPQVLHERQSVQKCVPRVRDSVTLSGSEFPIWEYTTANRT